MSDPCPAIFEYDERQIHCRILVSTCTVCGKEVGSNLLKSEDELHYWCDQVITPDDAKVSLKEFEDCHRAGITYSRYNGFHDDGTEMTPEEYEPVRQLLQRYAA